MPQQNSGSQQPVPPQHSSPDGQHGVGPQAATHCPAQHCSTPVQQSSTHSIPCDGPEKHCPLSHESPVHGSPSSQVMHKQGSPQRGSHGSVLVQQGLSGLQQGFGSPQQGSDGSQQRSGLPQQGLSGLQQRSESPQQGSDGLQQGSGSPQQGLVESQHRFESPQQLLDGSQQGSLLLQQGSVLLQQGSVLPQQGSVERAQGRGGHPPREGPPKGQHRAACMAATINVPGSTPSEGPGGIVTMTRFAGATQHGSYSKQQIGSTPPPMSPAVVSQRMPGSSGPKPITLRRMFGSSSPKPITLRMDSRVAWVQAVASID